MFAQSHSFPSTSSRPLPEQWGEACVGKTVANVAQAQVSSVRSLIGQIVAAVHSFAVWCGATACVHVSIHTRSTAGPPSERPMAAMSAFRQPLGRGSAASTTPPASRFGTNLHMKVAMQAPPNRTVHAPLCQQQAQAAGRSATLDPSARKCVCLLAQSATLVPAASSIFRQHVGCTVRLPSPLPPSPAATWCPRRPVFHKSQRPTIARRTIALRFLSFTRNCSHSWFRRTFVATFCMRASHADVYPELLQDAREPGDHI